MNEIYDYIEAGFKIFGLHGMQGDICTCGDPECEAFYKHPVISNWQNIPRWSEEQLETFEMMGHFKTGFGVIVSGHLVIDVDARNGGVESFKKLCKKIPEIKKAGFIVNTGSGNGSQHIYFKSPKSAMVQTLKDYPGIDFKTSGFVVGSGSLHKSGMRYETEKGFPDEITDAPAELISLLAKPDMYRATTSNGEIDISEENIIKMLSFIDPDIGYEEWIKTGMAIHHTLSGNGFEIWDSWSAKGSKYKGASGLERHWHSFGKSSSPAGIGTLMHYARMGGYTEEVTFVYDHECSQGDEINTSDIDLLRPPGFVGELCEWVNGQCLYPREHLAVAASLCAVGSLAGMRFVDELDDMTANIIAFCVAGSGTGKEAVQQAYLKIMRAAGVQGAVHGSFKSEQELMRNLMRHQCAFYSLDELGLTLRKLENASKKGGASYLEGIIGLVMSVYSKANGYLPISGDLKDDLKAQIMQELGKVRKAMDNLSADSSSEGKEKALKAEESRLETMLANIDNGLDSPFLTILGYTTPITFDSLMGFEQATNGFLSRAMIFNDLETNPKRKKNFKKMPMSDKLTAQIQNLHAPGVYDSQKRSRIEFNGSKSVIPTTEQGVAMLNRVYNSFHELAEDQKNLSGMEAIPRRGYEIASKVSLILAIPEGVRNEHHVRWAYALAMRDCMQKIKLAYATANEDSADNRTNAVAAKILSLVTKEHGETLGVICNKLRNIPKNEIKNTLQIMLDQNQLALEEYKNEKGRLVKKYFCSYI